MKSHNRIVVDLNKVQYCEYYYENQHGQRRFTKPKFSVHGQIRDPNEMAFGNTSTTKRRTLRELAKELGIVDVWTPRVRLQLTANHSLVYTGDKAVSMWNEWSKRIFNKKGKK